MIIKSLKTISIEKGYLWDRQLTGPSDIAVSIGQKVTKNTRLADMNVSLLGEKIDVASALEVSSSEVKKYLKCWNGEIVRQGDIIASKIERGGMIISEIKVKKSGMVDLTKIDSGIIGIKSPATKETLRAEVAGIVRSILPAKHVVIQTDVTRMCLFSVLGKDTDGELLFIRDKEEFEKYRSNFFGKILVLGFKLEMGALIRLNEFGINGLVMNSLSVDELKSCNLTLSKFVRDISFSLGILSSFGVCALPQIFPKIFEKYDQEGFVRISKRNKMLILAGADFIPKNILQKTEDEFQKIRKGILVKCIGGKYTGEWGKVEKVIDRQNVRVKFPEELFTVDYRNLLAF